MSGVPTICGVERNESNTRPSLKTKNKGVQIHFCICKRMLETGRNIQQMICSVDFLFGTHRRSSVVFLSHSRVVLKPLTTSGHGIHKSMEILGKNCNQWPRKCKSDLKIGDIGSNISVVRSGHCQSQVFSKKCRFVLECKLLNVQRTKMIDY